MRAIAVLVVSLVVVSGLGAVAWFALQDPQPPEGPGPAKPGVRKATPARAADPPAVAPPVPGPDGSDGPKAPVVIAAVPPPPPRKDEPPIPEPSAEMTPGAGARFFFPDWEPAISKVDWTHVGIACRKAQVTFRETVRKLDHGAELSAVLHPTIMASVTIDQMVGPIVNRAMNLSPGRPMRPPTGIPFTHPAFESNAIAATLDAWGRPLTKEQEPKVKALFDARFAEWTQMDSEGAASPWHFDEFVALTKSRIELQKKLEEILDRSQRDALWDPSTKGRAHLDLFSPSTLWRDQIAIIPIHEGMDAAEMIGGRMRGEMSIGRKVGPEFEAAALAWFKTCPQSWRDGLRGPVSRNGYITEAELMTALEPMAEFVRTVQVKAWRQHDLDPMLPPFRRVYLFSRLLR